MKILLDTVTRTYQDIVHMDKGEQIETILVGLDISYDVHIGDAKLKASLYLVDHSDPLDELTDKDIIEIIQRELESKQEEVDVSEPVVTVCYEKNGEHIPVEVIARSVIEQIEKKEKIRSRAIGMFRKGGK